MNPDWTWWALLLVTFAGLVLCTGLLTGLRTAAAMVGVILFAVALALTLIPVVSG